MSGQAAAARAAEALAVERVSVSFGELKAVREVSLRLPQGARHALIGPNGAGKSTLVGAITGAVSASGGRVLLNGEDLTRLGISARARRGLARTFQITSLFPEMTAIDSVALAIAEREGLTWRFLAPLGSRAAVMDEAREILEELGLADLLGRVVGELAYGHQRVMEIAIALASRPRVLLLDEPAAGIPAGESQRLFEVLERLSRDVTVLFIEHDMHLVRRFARRVTVLAAGQVLAEGTPAEVAADAGVRDAYLGTRGVRH
ncbi:ABC transporter ATP-binding protein [Aureimonas populi]|uniref:ABC transporter ATP-binding protein n=1 Tax=Aureimonas populi TaxID=1701758 RepID=A0ABW5CN13_9HYPH|nr:ABC transporter ATP-binding protein [Aureimonas populi]